MARQYFRELQEPVTLADLTAVTGTTEADLLATGTWVPIAANALRSGQLLKLTAWGSITTSTSPGNIQIIPRFGTSTGGTALGVITTAVALTASLGPIPWYLQASVVVRSIGSSGSMVLAGTLESQIMARDIVFGGVTTSVNTTTAAGLFMGVTLGAATVSMQTKGIAYETLN